MKILAVDDEAIALKGMVQAIHEAEPEAEVYSFRKASAALTFCKNNPCDTAFLDIQMRNISGVELAKEIKQLNPTINIIFATAYTDYRGEAFDMHASGYLLKPITAAKIRKELDDLRYPVPMKSGKRIRIHTFGNFEIYADDIPVSFKYTKTKEMIAYLVDRNGTYCNNEEIMAALWKDEKHASYLSNLKKDMVDTLYRLNCPEVVESTRGRMRICPENIECDYSDWCRGKAYAINRYKGEYMAQYSWAEFTNGELNRKTNQ